MKHANLAIFIPFAGCPHQCSFCDQHLITGAQRMPSIQLIEDMIKLCVSRPNHRRDLAQIAFFGGSFTCIPKEQMIALLEAASPYVEKGLFSGIRISTRPDGINEEMLNLLKKYHVTSIELGAQSMDPAVLQAARRGHTPEDTIQASKQIKDAGFTLGLQMLPGLPLDTPEKALDTAMRLIALKPQEMRVYPAVVFPGTSLYEQYKNGSYRPLSVDEALQWTIPIADEILKHKITLLKVGLHQADGAVAGAFHPAFGEMVRTGVFNKRLLERLPQKGVYTIKVHPKELSIALGQKRSNLDYWKSLGYELHFSPDTTAEFII
ncbi:MAG: radical SAM protein [Clostridia bacterium]|nr:radical SAM protein [Clostridia bacterium]